MKKDIYLHIPEPCHENWEQMSLVNQGRFCQSCCKQVVDFSRMSDKQILDVLSKTAGKTCGRFSEKQLARPIVHEVPPIINAYKLFVSAFIPAFLLANGNEAKAQIKGKVATKTVITRQVITMGDVVQKITKEEKITGTVKDEHQYPIADVTVMVKGTKTGTSTDANGRFSIDYPSSHKQKLQVSYVGYKTKEIEISKDCKHVHIILSNEDILSVGEVVVVGGYQIREYEEEDEALYYPPQKITYKGVVVNEDGQPVPYASIKTNINKGIIADSLGRFSIEVRENKKNFSFTVTSVGYQSQTSAVKLTGRTNDTIKIALKNNVAPDDVLISCSPKSLMGRMGLLSVVKAVTITDTATTIIQKAFNNEMFKAYPNPASPGSDIYLTFKKPDTYTVQLFDNNGRLYQSKEVKTDNGKQTIPLAIPAAMASGVYFLKAINTTANKQFIEKILIQ